MDDEKVGVSTALLISAPATATLRPGASTEIAFQAVDDNGEGVADQSVEVVITDLAKLHFKETSNNRSVFMTKQSENVNHVVLAGAVLVPLLVPTDARPGAVTVVASLGGDKGASSKTQWFNFEIETGEGGSAGAAGEGGAGGLSGAGGEGGVAGLAGAAESGGQPSEAGAGGMQSAGTGN